MSTRNYVFVVRSVTKRRPGELWQSFVAINDCLWRFPLCSHRAAGICGLVHRTLHGTSKVGGACSSTAIAMKIAKICVAGEVFLDPDGATVS